MAAPKNNLNAEKWNEEDSIELFNKAIELTEGNSEYDFIGEVAKELGTYRDVFTYLKDKFESCKHLYKQLSQNLEANCFSHSKKGEINTAVGIVNLKANYGWTDRIDTTTKDKEIKTTTIINLGEGKNPNE
jgi:hypothetical protein